MTTVAVMHPGRMGAALSAQLVSQQHRVLWHPAGRSSATRERANSAQIEAVDDLDELVGRSKIVLSICPSEHAVEVAAEAAAANFRGTYADLNAISPMTMAAIERVLAPGGATVADGAVFGPPPESGRGVRLCLAGPSDVTDVITRLFAGTRVDCSVLRKPLGAASALKMATNSYLRTSRMAAALAHAVADDYGVTDELLDEATRSGHHILAARDALPGVAARAWRWGPELQEVARMLQEADLPADIARATEQTLARLDGAKDDWDVTPEEVLAMLRRNTGGPSS